MNLILQGLKSFHRRLRHSLIASAMFFVIFLSLMFSSLILGICDIYKARNENPYSDYYRLLIDRKVVLADAGYESQDKMFSGSWYSIEAINSYFYDIVDYTAEVYGNTTANIDPFLPEWFSDSGYFLLYGLTDCMELSEFSRGELTLIDGRYLNAHDRYEDNRVCMIHEEIASLNHLSVGDAIDIKMHDGTNEAYTVVGVYRDHSVHSTLDASISYNLPQNRIFVPLSAFKRAYALGCYNYQIKLNNDALIEQVQQRVNQYGMCDGYPAYFVRVSDIFEANNRGIRALEDAFTIAQYSFIAVALLMILILIHSMLSSRKREFGIYLSLGRSKCAMTAMLLTELSACIIIGLLLSFAVVMLIGADASNLMLGGVLQNTSAEALRMTTSDAVQFQMNESDVIRVMIQSGFVQTAIRKALFTIVPIIIVSMLLTSFGIARIKVIDLLARQENL